MLKKIVISFLILSLAIGGYVGYQYYLKIYKPNVVLKNGKSQAELFIPTGSDFEQVKEILVKHHFIEDEASFEWVAQKKNYINKVKPGRYIIKKGMNNNELVNLLRSGAQTPVKVSFHNIRFKEELAGVIAKQIEADSVSLIQLLNDEDLARKYGFNKETFITMFIPNTYEMYWNTSAQEFVERMAKEYKAFWNDERKAKARKLGLSQSEVTILASIVQAEQNVKTDEQPVVAGLYLNRLKRNMQLQCDATLKFANKAYDVQRVLDSDKKIDSKYNTYKYTGLPPGPINLPEINAIDAVLNAKEHNYLYMCAKEDFSGYHNFTSSYNQHLRNAKKYQAELNKRKIYR
ncbi:MAG TPA: endolytic transglycosylase MltG [Flavobacteriales bacterium]|nr:endolytic transglycosylase MltG [Flavobacteriales bacterium]|tara:strand:+ start:85491 stop:86531 length:1041 start_codon:yes stop_codon:yes gene_type:complete